jgi:hypothetical protein
MRIEQKEENRERTRQIEREKKRTVDQAPEDQKKTEVIEQLKRKKQNS